MPTLLGLRVKDALSSELFTAPVVAKLTTQHDALVEDSCPPEMRNDGE